MTSPERHAVAADVVRRTLFAAPAPSGVRVVALDGPAGSGKTTLAHRVLERLAEQLAGETGGAGTVGRAGRVAAVHLDDVYPGWSGLEEGVARVARDLVGPLWAGRPAGYRRYDWSAGREAEWVAVAAVEVLVLDGVGSGALALAPFLTTLVWVEAPPDVRLRRGLERDAADRGLDRPDRQLREHWGRWQELETDHHARNRTRERADVVVDAGPPPSQTRGASTRK